MKTRGTLFPFILSLLVALTLMLLPGCLNNLDSLFSQKNKLNLSSQQAKIDPVSPAPAGQPTSPARKQEGTPLVPGKSHTPRQSIASTPEQQEQVIQQSLDRLSKGIFFHNVPSKMQVNRPVLVEAGIVKEMTAQTRKELRGQGDIRLREGVPYDPLGIDIELSADSNSFKVEQIIGHKGIPIVDSKPAIWSWQVTPQESGTHNLMIIATVHLHVPELERDYTRDYIVSRDPIAVQSDIGYSLQKLIVNYWQNIMLGTLAILLGLFPWRMVIRPRKHKSASRNEAKT